MPNFTKKAIKQSFIKLLNMRPLSQITVKDIVEDCGINRNTFYYHYEDLPTLLKEIVTELADEVIDEYPDVDSMEQCLEVALKFALENKKAALHIFNSVNRDIFEQYLLQVCEHVLGTYINKLFGDAKISDSDKTLIIRYYKSECFGIIIEWMCSGMDDDIMQNLHRIMELRNGMAEEMIRRCEQI